MNLVDVLDLVDRAMADLGPKGVENAWEKMDGETLTVLKWADIRDALRPFAGTSGVIASPAYPDPKPDPDSGRANGFLHDTTEGPL